MSQKAEHQPGFTENRRDSAWGMASPDRSVSQAELRRTSFVDHTRRRVSRVGRAITLGKLANGGLWTWESHRRSHQPGGVRLERARPIVVQWIPREIHPTRRSVRSM